MFSLNKVTIAGNLGQEPDLRYMPNGDAVCNITLATTETWKDKDGVKKEKTEWHRVTFYRKLGEIVGQWVKKGDPIYVEGRLETRKWTDKQGVERYTTEIIASDLKMLGGKKDDKPAKTSVQDQEPYKKADNARSFHKEDDQFATKQFNRNELETDDIPF